MFKITVNEYIKYRIIKYADENNNRLTVQADDLGDGFKIIGWTSTGKKFVNSFKFPFEDERIEFRFIDGSPAMPYAPMLLEVAKIIQRWVSISRCVKILLSDDFMKFLQYIDRDSLFVDETAESITDGLLKDLARHEETAPFAQIYRKFVFLDEPTAAQSK